VGVCIKLLILVQESYILLKLKRHIALQVKRVAVFALSFIVKFEFIY